MKDQYKYTINSTDDIRRALAEAEQEGYELTHYTARFDLRGQVGVPISVDSSLKDLHVVAHGPAPVYVSGKAVTVIAEKFSTVYAAGGSVVDAYDSASVYAYDRSAVDVGEDSAVYVASDDVIVNAFGNAKVYLPAPGVAGARATVNILDSANLIQADGAAVTAEN